MPSFRAAAVRVRVPATSANLGPGFDAAGLALGLYDVVEAQIIDKGLEIDIAGEGTDTLKRNERNLVAIAMRAAFDAMGGQPRGVRLLCANRIPQSRGLGSSAAAVVAGVSVARELVLGGLDDDRALGVATAVEGHPDNVAAALFGGLTFAWRDPDGATHAVRLPVAAEISPVAFVPTAARISTAKARALLPEAVPHADAAATAGRAALLATALGGRLDLLLPATEDRLHQPYRLEAQPRGRALLDKLRASGHAAVLSGSGPTVLALCASPAQAEAAAMAGGKAFEPLVLPVDTEGASVVS